MMWQSCSNLRGAQHGHVWIPTGLDRRSHRACRVSSSFSQPSGLVAPCRSARSRSRGPKAQDIVSCDFGRADKSIRTAEPRNASRGTAAWLGMPHVQAHGPGGRKAGQVTGCIVVPRAVAAAPVHEALRRGGSGPRPARLRRSRRLRRPAPVPARRAWEEPASWGGGGGESLV
eukprot:SAG31_NODE_114_length_24318_cov_16.787481_18_plen_173_part_00